MDNTARLVIGQKLMRNIIGKLLQTVEHFQLITFINDNQPVCNKQHVFTAGRSTLTNLLASETAIANVTSVRVTLSLFLF